MASFTELSTRLGQLRASETACYGDGNLDKRVDFDDIQGVGWYAGLPSTFDFNEDGTTNTDDLRCVLKNYGNNCLSTGPGASCK
jgi:hypothetical protein